MSAAATASQKIFITGAKRTPIGKFGGSFKDITPSALGGIAGKAALEESGKPPVDHVVFGGVIASDNRAPYLARHVGHASGLGYEVPALTINRLCGSGLQSIVNSAQMIRSGDSDIVLSGGVENMSLAPLTVNGGVRQGVRFGQEFKLEDSLLAALVDRAPSEIPMGVTSENVAERAGITREQCDEYALRSQQLWAKAHENGVFERETTPVEITSRKGTVTVTTDEHPRPQTTLESLQKLSPVFKKGGVTTAGNSSGIGDGAAANIIVGEEALNKHGLTPLARVVSYGVTAVDPAVMGIAPVTAIAEALKRADLPLEAMDLIEVNEAFAAQVLAVIKEANLPLDRTNINGGSIAMAHPLAASGARIIAHLTQQLIQKNLRYAIGSACIGGGQAVAIVLENPAKAN